MTETFLHRPACELCGTAQPRILHRTPFTAPFIAGFLARYYQERIPPGALDGAVYEIAQCSRCRFIWQTYILDTPGMQHLYGAWIGAESSLCKKESAGYQSYLRQAELIARFFPNTPHQNIAVLDFGMGWGHWCMAAQTCGYQVCGLEIAEDRVRFAQASGIDVIDDLTGRRFDFINAEQVFEHIPQPQGTLKALAAHLKPGGVIRVAVPNGAGMAKALAKPGWQPGKNALHPLEHINCFTRATLARMAKNAGLRPVGQPHLLTLRYGGKALLKGLAAKYYRRFFGTTVYFRVL